LLLLMMILLLLLLQGWNGSGTVFFSMCNLRCVFCQNWDISQKRAGGLQQKTPWYIPAPLSA
jgi:putative pyruvate formate lyase activating enzyme